MQYPNILVVTESPLSSTQGFGVTLTTLLEGWPNDSFYVFYRSRVFEDKQTPSLQNMANRMVYTPIPGHVIFHAIPFMFNRTPSWYGRYSTEWLDKALRKWKPDVIYSWYYSMSIPKYCDWLSEYYGCPHILHMGDDESLVRKQDEKVISRIYNRAAVRIAISHEMKEELEARYGVEFEVLHNGAADNLLEDEKSEKKQEDKLIIRYLGSLLHAHHWESIEDVTNAVKEYNSRGGRAVFEIYCDEWTKKRALELIDGKNIVYSGFAPKPENYRLMKSADLLVLPVTFSIKQYNWVRLSLPTKLPEYLASGTPTLVYGPRGTAPVEFCIRNNIATVYSERSVENLVEFFSKVENDREGYRKRALADRDFAKKNVSASAMRNKFHELVRISLGEKVWPEMN